MRPWCRGDPRSAGEQDRSIARLPEHVECEIAGVKLRNEIDQRAERGGGYRYAEPAGGAQESQPHETEQPAANRACDRARGAEQHGALGGIQFQCDAYRLDQLSDRSENGDKDEHGGSVRERGRGGEERRAGQHDLPTQPQEHREGEAENQPREHVRASRHSDAAAVPIVQPEAVAEQRDARPVAERQQADGAHCERGADGTEKPNCERLHFSLYTYHAELLGCREL